MLKRNLVVTKSAQKRLRRLPAEIQKGFWDCLETLFENPRHPSLRNKRVQGSRDNDWEFSITMNYRVIYTLDEHNLIVHEIGKHEDVF